jgi:putative ABC transport system permease protein
VVFGNTNWSTTINGVYNDFFEAREWSLADGRLFDQGEITRFGKVAIVGKTVASQLFGEDDPIGQVVRIRGIPFEIIGLVESKGQSSQGQDQDDIIFVPLTTGRNRLFGEPRGRIARVGTIMIKAQDGVDTQYVEERITELLRQRHRIRPTMENDFQVRNLTEILKTQDKAEYERVKLQNQQSLYLSTNWAKVENNLYYSYNENRTLSLLNMLQNVKYYLF